MLRGQFFVYFGENQSSMPWMGLLTIGALRS